MIKQNELYFYEFNGHRFLVIAICEDCEGVWLCRIDNEETTIHIAAKDLKVID